MAKAGTDWFPHDYAPTSDPKIQALIGEHGATGYGLYWRITEMLHTEPEHLLPLKKYMFLAIAKQMLASAEQVEAILKFAIDVCELFKTDGTNFWSERVNRNFDDRSKISQERSIAGKKGAIAKQLLKANKQTQAQDNTVQDNTYIKSDWCEWGKMIVEKRDQYWDAMRGRKVSEAEMDAFLSVATRNNWTITSQQEFRVSLKGFKMNGAPVKASGTDYKYN